MAKACSMGRTQDCPAAPQRSSWADLLNMAVPIVSALSNSNSGSDSSSGDAPASGQSVRSSGSGSNNNAQFLKDQIRRLQDQIDRNEKNVSEWENSKTHNQAAIDGLRRSIQREREQLLNFQQQLARQQ